MSIESTLEYIHSVKWRNSKPGLSRTRELLLRLGNPETRLRFIHVAGTNGKGSVSAMIASVLQKAGYRVGLYTSPYIHSFNERMQVNGEPISDAELETLTDIIRPFADAMEDAPTEFEIVTALGILYFERQKCDIVVLEVGMGGELDSTNVIPVPELAVITAIGFDHMDYLGGTIAQIASAKAGIIKPGGTVAAYGEDDEAVAVFMEKCAVAGASLALVDFSRLNVWELTLGGAWFDFAPYEDLYLPLAGAYQPKNAALAVTALEILRGKGYAISDGDIRGGLAEVKWPGRFEVLRRNPTVILDGAHNAHGIDAVCDSFRVLAGETKIVFLVGVMADKDVGAMMSRLAEHAQFFVAVTPNNPRAMDAEKLAELLYGFGVPSAAFGTVTEGARKAMKLAGQNGVVAALGSLYFSSEVRKAFAAIMNFEL